MSQDQEPTQPNWLARFFIWLAGLFGGGQPPAAPPPAEETPPVKETPPAEAPPPPAEETPPVKETPPSEEPPSAGERPTGGELMGIVGAFKPLSSAVPPENFMLCDGRLLAIDDYLALFAVIGARFGGDGLENFALPQLASPAPGVDSATDTLPFAICVAGYFPIAGANPAEWPPAAGAEALIERRAQAFRDCYAQGGDPFGRHRHITELDPEWLARQAQNMIDAYGVGYDPLAGHTHVNDLDPEWLARQTQVVLDAHEQGRNPHHRHAHAGDLDPDWLERQAQVLRDAYARGEDPHFRHPTPAEAEDEINERVAALQALHAAGGDVMATMISQSPAAAPLASEAVAGSPADDLTRIEGIGPKIATALQEAGVRTYAQLASAPVAKLEALMVQSGYRLADPATWPKQAALAAAGQWAELEALQAELTGGRRG